MHHISIEGKTLWLPSPVMPGLGSLEHHGVVTDCDRVVVVEQLLLYAPVVHHGAVGAGKVIDVELSAFQVDARVVR